MPTDKVGADLCSFSHQSLHLESCLSVACDCHGIIVVDEELRAVKTEVIEAYLQKLNQAIGSDPRTSKRRIAHNDLANVGQAVLPIYRGVD